MKGKGKSRRNSEQRGRRGQRRGDRARTETGKRIRREQVSTGRKREGGGRGD